jgi:uncharacterized protein with FMN-binding domain
MRVSRFARGVTLCALSCVLVGALLSCAVNKADLARRVDLRNVDLKLVPDGVYEGSYTIQPPPPAMAANKTVQVRVTVAGGKYATIEILNPPRVGESAAIRTLISRVQESQDLSMDAVSGATITSTAVLKAIQNAVSSTGN